MPASKPYVFAPKYSTVPTLGRSFNVPTLARWSLPLTLWGGATGMAVFFFADSIPTLRRMIYEKLPIVGSHYDDSVNPEDSPF